MKWEEVFAGKCFISDLGAVEKIELGHGQVSLMQYAAWAPVDGGTKHQIVEISCNLDHLMEKYDIPPERICTVA